jgi:ATP-dependent Clp protease ATP-binding subunit ClpB
MSSFSLLFSPFSQIYSSFLEHSGLAGGEPPSLDFNTFQTKINSDRFSIEDFTLLRRENIRISIKNLSEEELGHFLKNIIDKGISLDSERLFCELAEALKMGTIESLIKNNRKEGSEDSVIELAKALMKDYPKPIVFSFKDAVFSDWKKLKPHLIYFFPNIINIFLDFFNFLDLYRKCNTLWDKYLFLEIVCKFVLIPSTLIQVLRPILVVQFRVYAVFTGVIAAGCLGVAAYKKWLKPLPYQIPHCNNLNRDLELSAVHAKKTHSLFMEKFIGLLSNGSNVLIVGKAGEGKSKLIDQLLHRKKKGSLDNRLSNLGYYSLNCGALMGSGTFGHSDLLMQTKDAIKGAEGQICLILDDVDHLTKDPTCFEAFKRELLNEKKDTPRIVCITTLEGFEKIKRLDQDGSFIRRVEKLEMDQASEDDCDLVVNDIFNREAGHIPIISNDAYTKLRELSIKKDYLPHVGRLGKIKKIMKIALAQCTSVYSETYRSPEWIKADTEYKRLKGDPSSIKGDPESRLEKMNQMRNNLAACEHNLDLVKQKMKGIRGLLKNQSDFFSKYIEKMHHLAKSKPSEVTEFDRKKFLLYHRYGATAFSRSIDQAIASVKEDHSKIAVQIDGNLIQSVFDELLRTESGEVSARAV